MTVEAGQIAGLVGAEQLLSVRVGMRLGFYRLSRQALSEWYNE